MPAAALPAEISWNLYGPFFCEDNVYQANHAFVNSSRWPGGKGGDGLALLLAVLEQHPHLRAQQPQPPVESARE